MSATPVADLLEVGLVQADLVWQDPAANRLRLADLMDRQPGCQLYVLPETFTTGFLGDAGAPAETMDGLTLTWLREQAAERTAAICGSVALDDFDGKRRNRFLFVTPEGSIHFYDKRHRFSYGGEDERYAAGQLPVTIEWRGWRIDLQVCYDLRFPVWCRNDRDFDIQIFVANWPTPRVDAWCCLLKARAVENQAYVLGVNRVGTDGNDVPYPGASMACGPGGECLLELGGLEGTGRVTLSRAGLHALREKLPFLADRDAYRLEPWQD